MGELWRTQGVAATPERRDYSYSKGQAQFQRVKKRGRNCSCVSWVAGPPRSGSWFFTVSLSFRSMEKLVDRFRTVRQPPVWVYLLLAVVTTISFAVSFPVGLDVVEGIAIEGLYLVFAAVIGIPIRRLEIGVLEIGWLVFLWGRYIDFLDELLVEPEPLVEPYLSGLFMVVSFAILIAGSFTLLEERRRDLELLSARNEELELKNTAIEEAPIGITIADMTEAEEPLISVNQGFTRMTGYAVEKTIGRNCRFLQGEDTSNEPVRRMREAIDSGESVQVTLRNYRKDGTRFWNEITLAPLERNGAVPNYVGFQQDVTERVEYEQQLQAQRDNLHLLSQMVRHDIRNDLQIIQMNVELLADHVSDDGEDIIETVEARTRNAIDLTTTARELSETMLDDERAQKRTSLTDAVGGQIEEVQSTFEDAVVERDGRFPDVTVAADEMLDSVFRNLLKNAIQHNDSDTPRVTVSVTADGEHATVRIADNGPGIPDDRKADIFQKGEKGLESEGTGIGTHLVETLVTQYGGEVWVEDNDPEGAVFVVELPLAE